MKFNFSTSPSLLIVTPYAAPEGGGLEMYADHMGKELVERGWTVHQMALTQGASGVENRSGQLVIRKKAHAVFSNTPIRLSFLFELVSWIRKNNISLIHAHLPVPFAADMAALASRLTRLPLVLTYHSSTLFRDQWLMDIVTRCYLPFQAWTLSAAKVTAAVSKAAVPMLERHCKRVVVLPPGVDLQKFSFEPTFSSNPNVLFIGPLSSAYPSKGCEVLLRAFVQVVQNLPQSYLTIVGGGDRLETMKEISKALGIEKHVHFLDRQPHDAIPRLIKETHLLVVPSLKSEGSPTVILEAMAMGRPVVGTRVGGIPDLIHDGQTGYVIPPNQDLPLAQKIIECLVKPGLKEKMGQAGREEVERHFDWETIVREYERLYIEILS